MQCRPAVVVFLAAVLAALPAAAQDHELVYEFPMDALQRSLRDDRETSLEQLLARSVEVVAARAGEGITVKRTDGRSFVVTVPAARIAELPQLRRRVEAAGTLEMRIVAAPPRRDAETEFDMPAERRRLQAWLDAGGRDKVLADPRALDTFHADAERGPVAPGKLRWCVHRIRADAERKGRWSFSFHGLPAFETNCIPLFGEQQWNDGVVPPAPDGAAATPLVELVALDLQEIGSTHEDVDTGAVTVQKDGRSACVFYSIRGARTALYVDWTRKYVGRFCAIVWNGELVSAPRLESALPGHGIIMGDLSVDECEDLANALRAGALPAAPRFVISRAADK